MFFTKVEGSIIFKIKLRWYRLNLPQEIDLKLIPVWGMIFLSRPSSEPIYNISTELSYFLISLITAKTGEI